LDDNLKNKKKTIKIGRFSETAPEKKGTSPFRQDFCSVLKNYSIHAPDQAPHYTAGSRLKRGRKP